MNQQQQSLCDLIPQLSQEQITEINLTVGADNYQTVIVPNYPGTGFKGPMSEITDILNAVQTWHEFVEVAVELNASGFIVTMADGSYKPGQPQGLPPGRPK